MSPICQTDIHVTFCLFLPYHSTNHYKPQPGEGMRRKRWKSPFLEMRKSEAGLFTHAIASALAICKYGFWKKQLHCGESWWTASKSCHPSRRHQYWDTLTSHTRCHGTPKQTQFRKSCLKRITWRNPGGSISHSPLAFCYCNKTPERTQLEGWRACFGMVVFEVWVYGWLCHFGVYPREILAYAGGGYSHLMVARKQKQGEGNG